MSTCIIDGKTTGDGYQLCYSCGEALECDLAEVSGVLADLGAVVTRKAKGAPSVGGGNSTENPLPLDLDAMRKGKVLVSLLASWVLNVADDTGAACPSADPGKMTDYLRSHADFIRRQDYGQDMKHEVREALNACRQASDRAAERIRLGACNASFEGEVCPGTMVAFTHQREARCDVCGETCDVAERKQALAAEAWGILETLPEMCRILTQSKLAKLDYQRAKKWVQRGQLYADICHVPTKQQYYSPATVIHAYQQMNARNTQRQTT